jgi:hypothetical protein
MTTEKETACSNDMTFEEVQRFCRFPLYRVSFDDNPSNVLVECADFETLEEAMNCTGNYSDALINIMITRMPVGAKEAFPISGPVVPKTGDIIISRACWDETYGILHVTS